jgi:ABC-type sugar transport system ATPase subunit
MTEVVLKNLQKRYGSFQALSDVNLVIPDDQFTVLLGPSGCGKSTLLRMIAGLEDITGGEILIGDSVVNDIDASRRGCAMVFQNYALYPHKTVANNIAFPLRMAGVRRAEIDKRVAEVAGVLQLGPLLSRLPRELSGGQRQRVAMGRAMIRQPQVYLFDEPLSNLDAELRVKMRLEISRLRDRLSATMVFVTHDQVEAMTLAHQVVVMSSGRIEQVGSPLDVYEQPTNRFVAGFVGSPKMSFFDIDAIETAGSGTRLRLAGGAALDVPFAVPERPRAIGIRPENARIGQHRDWSPLAFDGSLSLLGAEHLGDRSYAYLAGPFGELTVLGAETGHTVDVTGSPYIDAGKVHFFAEDGRTIRAQTSN